MLSVSRRLIAVACLGATALARRVNILSAGG
jgi:hypothetical protein